MLFFTVYLYNKQESSTHKKLSKENFAVNEFQKRLRYNASLEALFILIYINKINC